MAKKIHEMLPHQYCEYISRKKGEKRFSWVSYYYLSDMLQGKSIATWRLPKDKVARLEQLKVEVLDEYWLHIYKAVRAGHKVAHRILRMKPDLAAYAEEKRWDKQVDFMLENGELELAKPTEPKPKAKKPTPARDDPQDKFEEKFARDDVGDRW